jgi:hypothetical protein
MSGLSIAHVLDRAPAAAAHVTAGAAAPLPADAEGFEALSLPRHGMRPLRVTARLLAEITTRSDALPIWSRIAVYETGGEDRARAPFVATIAHRLRLLGPPDPAFAELLSDAEAVLRFFRAHDPVAEVPAAAFVGDAGGEESECGATLAKAIAAHRAAWRQLLQAMFGRDR